MFSSVIRPVCRNSTYLSGANNFVRHAHQPAKSGSSVLMDQLPVPEGSWAVHHQAKNSKYNIHLIGGILFFIGTIAFGKASGILYFNATVPELPKK